MFDPLTEEILIDDQVLRSEVRSGSEWPTESDRAPDDVWLLIYTVLDHWLWSDLSDEAIGQMCVVPPALVARLRQLKKGTPISPEDFKVAKARISQLERELEQARALVSDLAVFEVSSDDLTASLGAKLVTRWNPETDQLPLAPPRKRRIAASG